MLDSHPTLALFGEFVRVPSPPGREERFADLVRAKVESAGYEHETDPAGNVTVVIPGTKPDLPTVIYAAHMDEIGMVVTRVHEDGSLSVDKSGGLYPWKIGERPVVVLGDNETLPGVVSMGSIHTRKVRTRGAPDWEDVRILTGLAPERLAGAGIRPGSSAVPDPADRGPVLLGGGEDPLVAAWTFDDRIDVVNLILLLRELRAKALQPLRTSVFAFTVHEEGGCHGAKYVAKRLSPELFVAVDGCPVLPELDLAMDGKPGIWSKDALTHFDQSVVAHFLRCAREVGTEMMPAVFDGAASDASAVYAAGHAPRAATVGHIRDSSHGFEVARLSSVENVRRTLLRFMLSWG